MMQPRAWSTASHSLPAVQLALARHPTRGAYGQLPTADNVANVVSREASGSEAIRACARRGLWSIPRPNHGKGRGGHRRRQRAETFSLGARVVAITINLNASRAGALPTAGQGPVVQGRCRAARGALCKRWAAMPRPPWTLNCSRAPAVGHLVLYLGSLLRMVLLGYLPCRLDPAH